MPQVDWNAIMTGQTQPRKRYQGANVKFFYAYNENEQKSLEAGRPIFDEIPSISIQWPGHDETVRRIEPQDIQEYPEAYARFKAGSDPVSDGTPLAEWPMMTGSAMREFQYLGFKTVEQLAQATDEAQRKMGPLSKFAKLAKEWLDAAQSSQNNVVKLKQLLDQEINKRHRLEEKLEFLMQRIEASEGTDLRDERRTMAPLKTNPVFTNSTEDLSDLDLDDVEEPVVKRRGRPRKI